MISVILPVYRSLPYLEECFRSVCAQTYRELEILLVDDGSPDGSGALADALAAGESRARVIHRENGGAAAARNTGLDAARGEYIAFVDDDDWLEPELYGTLLALLEKQGADMAVCAAALHGKRRLGSTDPDYPREGRPRLWSREEAMEELADNFRLNNAVYTKLYRRELFDGLRFRTDVFLEDFEILPELVLRCERVAYTPRMLYHYRIRPDSMMHSAGRKHLRLMEQSRRRMALYEECFPRLREAALANHVTNGIATLCSTAGDREIRPQRRAVRREIRAGMSVGVWRRLNFYNRVGVLALGAGLPVFDLALRVFDRVFSI